MGCGRSKHAAATAKTAFQQKKSKFNYERSKDRETVPETFIGDNETESSKLEERGKSGDNEPGRSTSKNPIKEFLFSGKDEEAMEGIMSDGLSANSEYYTPLHGIAKEGSGDEAEEETEGNEDAKTEKGKGDMTEENLTKVEEAASAVEAKVSTPAVEEKNIEALTQITSKEKSMATVEVEGS